MGSFRIYYTTFCSYMRRGIWNVDGHWPGSRLDCAVDSGVLPETPGKALESGSEGGQGNPLLPPNQQS